MINNKLINRKWVVVIAVVVIAVMVFVFDCITVYCFAWHRNMQIGSWYPLLIAACFVSSHVTLVCTVKFVYGKLL